MIEAYTFDDLLIKPKTTSSVMSRHDTDTTTSLYDIKLEMPAISASMSLFDTSEEVREIRYKFAIAMHEAGSLHIFSRATLFPCRITAVRSLSSGGIRCGLSVSLKEFEVYRSELLSLPPDTVVSIDIANGAIIRDILWPAEGPVLIVGNYGNPGAVLRRDLAGKVAFKMGVGSGAGCTTRIATGVGAPQAWLISETKKISRKPMISDGGIKCVADFVKALALGADIVMMGKIFAAAKETPWSPVRGPDGKWYKPYRGMASKEEKGVQSYIEGESGFIPYEDRTLQEIMRDLKDGLTSAMAYLDARTLDDLQKNAEFIKSTPPTKTENGTRLIKFAHDTR